MRFKNSSRLFLLILIFSMSPSIFSKEADATTAADMLPELILRPVGVLSSAFGAGLFLACSPMSALATILEPHDALEKTYNAFVVTPVRYTFLRPIGEYSLLMDAD